MTRIFDFTGERFGRLVARWPSGMKQRSRLRSTLWLCTCDCGELVLITASEIRDRKSCGCQQREKLLEESKKLPAKTHGHWVGGKASREWRSWMAMRQRCYYSKDQDFHAYGARGITVCERWKDSFDNFLADMGTRPEGKSLDRYPNPDGNYEPTNCRWATPIEQRRNWRSDATHKAKAATA